MTTETATAVGKQDALKDYASAASLIIPLLFALSLGLFRIGQGEAHVDVYQVQGVFSVGWLDLVKDFFTPSGLYGGFQAPVYFLLAKAFGTLFGDGIAILRGFSVIALVLLTLLSWAAYPLLTDSTDPLPRFLFVLLVAASPVNVWWAQTAKYTLWFTFLSAVSVVAGLRFLEKEDRRSAIVMALGVVLMIYTHYFGLLIAAAQYVIVGVLLLFQRRIVHLYRLVLSGLLAILLTLPLLATVYQAAQLRVAEHYHFTQEARVDALTVLRGVLFEWLFGYGLNPRHGLVAEAKGLLAAVLTGNLRAASMTLGSLLPIVFATFVLGVSLLLALYGITKHSTFSARGSYLLGVPALVWLGSQLLHLSFRFTYLGVGAWCVLAFLAAGWSVFQQRRIYVVASICFLVVYVSSLATYYDNMPLRYPGMALVASYVNRHEGDIDVAIIDRWLIRNRGSAQEYRLPDNIRLIEVDSIADIPLATIKRERTVYFGGGLRDKVEADFKVLQQSHPGMQWSFVNQWPSLELPERSINAYRVMYDGG